MKQYNSLGRNSSSGEEDNILPFNFNQQAPVLCTTYNSNIYDIYLDEPIREPSYYRNAFQTLRNVSEGDVVRIFINTPGGNASTAIQFINLIRECSAEVIGVLEGEGYSAGGLILLNCPNIKIAPFSTLMAHTAFYGTVGTAKNVKDQVDFNDAEVERLIRSTYKYFLTEDEIEEVLNNKEIWLNDEQIGERLQRMFEMQAEEEECSCGECDLSDEEIEAFMKQMEETEIEESPPKKKAPRKRASKKTESKE